MVDQEFTVEENCPGGTIIGKVEASDRDEGQVLAFEIIDGNEDDVFEIDPSCGNLLISDPANLDYENQTEFLLTVVVSDGHNKDPLESAARIRIGVKDVNEYAPEIESSVFTIDENPYRGQEIGVVIASDKESHQSLYYQIAGQNDRGYFHLDSLSGSLSVLDTAGFDYEVNQSLSVLIRVSDNHTNSLSDTSTITVQLNNVPELQHLTLSLQPDGDRGKDAIVGMIVPDNNYGSTPDLHLYAWTQGGILNVNRIMMDFDLSSMSSDVQIDSAFLSLYFNTTSAYGDQHEGENSFLIQRITSDWIESEVTWRTQPSTTDKNQVFVEGTGLPTQDYTDMDITGLLRDMFEDGSNSFGMLLRLNNEAPYRKMLLASSDHPLEALRPKLDIYYTTID